MGKNDVYKTKLLGLGTPPGVISLRLPSTVSLKADKIMIGTCIFIVIRKTKISLFRQWFWFDGLNA